MRSNICIMNISFLFCEFSVLNKQEKIAKIQSFDIHLPRSRAETKALIGGGCIFIYSRSARRISFEINGNDN